MRSAWIRPIALGLLVGALSACSSLEGHYVGTPKTGDDIGGLPIMVERPRWLKVTVKQVTYVLVSREDETVESETGVRVTPVVRELAREVSTEITTEVIGVAELFALDVKRPAAGTIDYALEFPDGHPYPKSLKATIDDRTIAEAAAALKEITEAAGNLAKTAVGLPTTGVVAARVERVKLAETVVSVKLIDLLDPSKVTVLE